MPSSSFSRFAVFSDVHANLPALHAFFEDVETQDCERMFCCGDLVGYGAHPAECCELIQMCEIPVVMGNHDFVCARNEPVGYFNDAAREAVLWTRRALEPGHTAYLEQLPYVRVEDDFTFVHASPREPEKWNYVLTRGEAADNFCCFDNWICFIGHSHQPFVVEKREDEIACPDAGEIELHRAHRYLINVGSIGQPRDRDPRLCYVIVDLNKMRLSFRRAAYPVFEAQRAILAAGLPPELAERLSLGW